MGPGCHWFIKKRTHHILAVRSVSNVDGSFRLVSPLAEELTLMFVRPFPVGVWNPSTVNLSSRTTNYY